MIIESDDGKGDFMIRFESGDILQADTEYIAQGVATGSQEGAGTGLARKISTKWPDVQQQFKKFTRSNAFEGGAIFVVAPLLIRPGVIYIATQPDMYHATLTYLNKGLRRLADYCAKNAVVSVSLPKIGAGLGKLNWVSEVKPLMSQYLRDSKTLFVVYEDFKRQYEEPTNSA